MGLFYCQLISQGVISEPEEVSEKLEQAEQFFRAGLNVFRTRFNDPLHVNTIIVESNLGECLQLRGKHAEAAEAFVNAGSAVKVLQGELSVAYANNRFYLGQAYEGVGDNARAIAAYEESRTAYIGAFGVDDSNTIAVENILARLRTGNGRAGSSLGASV